MSVLRANALLGRIGALLIVLKQISIVVGLHKERVHALHHFPNPSRDVSQIAQNSQSPPRAAEYKPQRVHGIMRHGTAGDLPAHQREGLTRMNDLPVPLVGRFKGFPHDLASQRGAIDGRGKFSSQNFQSPHMIPMLMGE